MTGILSIQFNPKIGDKKANLKRVESFLEENKDKKPDLVLVPEFFSTGIDHNSFINFPEDENGGLVIDKMKELAVKYNTNIISGSVIEKFEGKLYNTSFAINREGEIVGKYRKIHLFNYNGGTEGERITAGLEPVVVDFDFGKVGLNICYDFRYPMLQKTLAKMGAEILVCPTAWCIPNTADFEAARDIWVSLNKTRAYDNLVYTVSSNQTGKSNDRISCIGYSAIISPEGIIIKNAKDKEDAIYADIDLGIVREYKKTYPIAEID